jgi:hypothetical protein
MTSFANAFTKMTNKTTTENGAVVEISTGSPILDFSHKVVRDTTPTEIKTRITEIINYIETNNDVNGLHDLFVLMFHKRNPRGGEGEKAMTYHMLLNLYDHYPRTIVQLTRLIAEFGYYKDFYQIWELVWNIVQIELKDLTGEEHKKALLFNYDKYNPLIEEIIKYTIQQRNSDLNTLSDDKTTISLIGKWIPSQNGHFAKKVFWYMRDNDGMMLKKKCIDMLVHHLAFQAGVKLDSGRKFPSFWYQKYRTGNSLLNKKLNVPEIAMCANRYSDIKLEQVASRAMAKYRKAFMNEQLKVTPKNHEESTGNRFPDRVDRVDARKNFKLLLEEKASEKLKSSGIEPHEILTKIAVPTVSSMDKQALTALWEAKKLDVLKHFKEIMDDSRPGKLIPMVDVSESMTYSTGPTPLSVAISLGIMTSELHPEDSPFRNMMLSFTDVPTFFKFRPEQDLVQRFKNVNAHKGYNTNFRLAMEELLTMCITNKVTEDDIPDLIVFSDGQFDTWGSRGGWTTHHQSLMKMWVQGGYTKVPRIIYWNLRGGTPGFQTDQHHPGVQMLQGFSPNLIKFVLYGEQFNEKVQEVEVDGKIVKMKVSSVTPWETFRAIMDQSRYDIVRVIMNASDEKLLKNYNFETPVDNEIETETETETTTKDDTLEGYELV